MWGRKFGVKGLAMSTDTNECPHRQVVHIRSVTASRYAEVWKWVGKLVRIYFCGTQNNTRQSQKQSSLRFSNKYAPGKQYATIKLSLPEAGFL